MGILYYTKYKSKLAHKTVYNYTITYFMIPMITGLKFFENLKNKQINFRAKYNLMALNKKIIDMWNI